AEPESAGRGIDPVPSCQPTRFSCARDRPFFASCDGDGSLALQRLRLRGGACRPGKSGLSPNWVSEACPDFSQGFGNGARVRATAPALPKPCLCGIAGRTADKPRP